MKTVGSVIGWLAAFVVVIGFAWWMGGANADDGRADAMVKASSAPSATPSNTPSSDASATDLAETKGKSSSDTNEEDNTSPPEATTPPEDKATPPPEQKKVVPPVDSNNFIAFSSETGLITEFVRAGKTEFAMWNSDDDIRMNYSADGKYDASKAITQYTAHPMNVIELRQYADSGVPFPLTAYLQQ